MAGIKLPFLVRDVDRYGTQRFYVRMRGRKERLSGIPGSVEWAAHYQAAVARLSDAGALPNKATRPREGSLEWLGRLYTASNTFKRLDARSQRNRLAIFEACWTEPLTPQSTARIGDCPLSALNARHIVTLRDRRDSHPGAANARLKYLSALFAWAVEAGKIERNPCRDVKPLRYQSDGFHTWTPEEIRRYEARHPIGTRARLAFALLAHTGARRGDVVYLGRQHIQREPDGSFVIVFTPQKTRKSTGIRVTIPLAAELAETIAAGPCGALTFLETGQKRPKPFTAAGFGGWFRERCDEAGLPHCTAHGVRKADATLAAERGATDRQLMAIFGWSSASQASVYTRAAERKLLAKGAGVLLDRERTGDGSVPLGKPQMSNTLKTKV